MERKIYFRIDETRVKCEDCREIVSSDNTVLKSELVNALEERVSFLRTENILLRKIIEEKEEKCKFIIEVKNLQEDKITYLQEENKKYQYKNNETKKVKQSIPKAVNKPKIAAECQGTTHSQSEEEEVDKRQSEMSVVTVTEEKENTENNEGDDNDNFKQVKTRRRRPQTKNRNQSKYIGCNEEISEFTGAQPKVCEKRSE
ncbi:hypothetical protein JTB14_033735 [Gonioctena quinquepunctata]|nr:hypothetical protein JTB14_033735 [Gonioctena quinquepunctata]